MYILRKKNIEILKERNIVTTRKYFLKFKKGYKSTHAFITSSPKKIFLLFIYLFIWTNWRLTENLF